MNELGKAFIKASKINKQILITRQTSIDCYNEIKKSGLLSKRRLEVYETLLKSAPCTSSEALRASSAKFGVFGVSSRFTELRDLGVIYEKRTRECNVTGRTVIEWDLTDELPIKGKIPKKVTLSEKKLELLKDVKRLGLMIKTCNRDTVRVELLAIHEKIKDL